MGKISSYTYNTSPTTTDYMIGDSATGPATYRYKIGDLITTFFNNAPNAAVKAQNIDFTTFSWSAVRTGTVNTSSPGSFAFTALNGGLTLTFPAVNGSKYEVFISANYVTSSATTQFDIGAQITGVSGNPIDAISTSMPSGGGLPMMGRYLFTATSTGNITVTCGVLSGVSSTIRTDFYMVTVRQTG